jgi:hypothetical protein
MGWVVNTDKRKAATRACVAPSTAMLAPNLKNWEEEKGNQPSQWGN